MERTGGGTPAPFDHGSGSGGMGRVTERRKVLRIREGAVSERPDTLAGEEPLEIRLGGRPLAVTMRTPGDDFALAAGFASAETRKDTQGIERVVIGKMYDLEQLF